MAAERKVSLDRLRAAAQTAVDASSIRSVAAQMGLSFTALRWFLRGGTPQAASQKRLYEWFVAGPKPTTSPIKAEVSAAIDLLASFLAAPATASVSRSRMKQVASGLLSGLSGEGRAEFLAAAETAPQARGAKSRKSAASTPSGGRSRKHK